MRTGSGVTILEATFSLSCVHIAPHPRRTSDDGVWDTVVDYADPRFTDDVISEWI